MASLKLMFLFSTIMLAMVLAQDYDGGEGGEGEYAGYEGGDDDGGYSGGDSGGEYEGGGDDEYAAAPQAGGEETAEGGEGDEGAAAAASQQKIVKALKNENEKPKQRRRRSLTPDDSMRIHRRVRRGHGYGHVGPVYTYVKTDYHGNFKWGVRHNVGRGYGGHGGYGHGK